MHNTAAQVIALSVHEQYVPSVLQQLLLSLFADMTGVIVVTTMPMPISVFV